MIAAKRQAPVLGVRWHPSLPGGLVEICGAQPPGGGDCNGCVLPRGHECDHHCNGIRFASFPHDDWPVTAADFERVSP